MQQLGAENMWNIKSLAKQLAQTAGDAGDDDVPQLVENFDEASKNETTTLPLPVSEGAAVETKSTENTQPPAAATA
jgi:hypothetical protein